MLEGVGLRRPRNFCTLPAVAIDRTRARPTLVPLSLRPRLSLHSIGHFLLRHAEHWRFQFEHTQASHEANEVTASLMVALHLLNRNSSERQFSESAGTVRGRLETALA